DLDHHHRGVPVLPPRRRGDLIAFLALDHVVGVGELFLERVDVGAPAAVERQSGGVDQRKAAQLEQLRRRPLPYLEGDPSEVCQRFGDVRPRVDVLGRLDREAPSDGGRSRSRGPALVFPYLPFCSCLGRIRCFSAASNCSKSTRHLSKSAYSARSPPPIVSGQRLARSLLRQADIATANRKAMMMADEESKLLSRAQVAALFRVTPRTVLRWTKSGKLNPIRTAAGHPRYRQDEVRAVLREMDTPSSSTGSSGEAG
ncbi:MAG: hypothetical protein QOD46_639, partial [Actinomycetota bacterium]|nr:hypothetical protein [Actinomycetota bacterium]